MHEVPLLICTYLQGALRKVEQHVVHLRESGMSRACDQRMQAGSAILLHRDRGAVWGHGSYCRDCARFSRCTRVLALGDCGGCRACAHRHGLRVVLVVKLAWSGLRSASLAQLGLLVDRSGLLGAWSSVARGGRGTRGPFHRAAKTDTIARKPTELVVTLQKSQKGRDFC